MAIPIFRCKDCTRRHPGCHATCEQYKEDVALNEKRKHEEYMKNQASMYIYKHVGDVLDNRAKSRKAQSGYMRFSKGTG